MNEQSATPVREIQRLSPEGARLMRIARERIKAHPDEFNMSAWGSRTMCGTTYCIGGHMALANGERLEEFTPPDISSGFRYFGFPDGWAYRLNVVCGFPRNGNRFRSVDGLGSLFYQCHNPRDVNEAVENINRFLFAHGYPPDEIPAVELVEVSDAAAIA